MAFVEYKHNNYVVPLQDVSQQTVTMIVPINSDSFLVIEANNKYKLYRIREIAVLQSGQLPKQFTASKYIRPLLDFKQHFIYLITNEFSICKLYFKNGFQELRPAVIPFVPISPNTISIDYKIIESSGRYLLGKIQNLQNKSCNIFIYDWHNQIYSNQIMLGFQFFNSVISNFTSTCYEGSQGLVNCQMKFIIFAEDGNKIHYNYLGWEIIHQLHEKNQGYIQKIVIKQSGKKTINTNCFPIAAHLQLPFAFILANSEQRPVILKVNIENNEHSSIALKLGKQQHRGLIKSYLGFIDNKLIFSVLNLKFRFEEMYSLSLALLQKQQYNQLEALPIITLQQPNNSYDNYSLGPVYPSIDGYSFHKYSFSHEKIVKMLRKEQKDYLTQLKMQIIYRVPKKYFYHQIAEQLGFSTGLTHLILSLL